MRLEVVPSAMDSLRVAPGPNADGAFRSGMMAAAVLALAGLGVLHWSGQLTLVLTGVVLLLLFPVYLVVVASALSVWLGYDGDMSDLRPVYREPERSQRGP
jgi:hypothetical protein